MDADRIVSHLTVPPNALAGLAAISAAEGTGGPDGYRALYGWQPGRDDRLFDSFADHPRRRFWIKTGLEVAPGETFGPADTTTAAGKYQINVPTFTRLTRTWPGRWQGFGPDVQDSMALELIDECRGSVAMLAGDMATFCARCSSTWASLPGATAGQPTRPLAFIAQAFQNSGGTLA